MKKILLFFLISFNLMAGNSFFSKAIGRSVVYGCPEYDDEFVFEKTGDINGDGYIDIIGKLNVWNGWTYCIWIMYGSSERFPEEISICDYSGKMTYIYGNGNWDYLVGIQVGDFNGDGYDDIVIGNWWTTIQVDYPETFIIYGSPDLPEQIEIGNFPSNLKVTRIEARDENSYLGRYISTGDMNGDGYDDLILSEVADPDLNKEGILYIIYSSPNGLPSFIDISNPPANTKIILGPDPNYWFGYKFDAKDVNNDGKIDLIIALKWSDVYEEGKRIILIYFGEQENFPSKVDLSNMPENSISIYDANIKDSHLDEPILVYDFDGDDFNDLIIASANADRPGKKKSYEGKIYILYGKPNGFPKTIDLANPPEDYTIIYGAEKLDGLGYYISLGDIDNDGIADIISSTYWWNEFRGKIWIIYGNEERFQNVVDLANPPSEIKFYTMEGVEYYERLGKNIKIDDLDKDGLKDFIFSSCIHRSYSGRYICEFNIFYYSLFKFIN